MKVLAEHLPTPELHRVVQWLRGPRQPWTITGHCRERMEEWLLTLADLDTCYRRGMLVEVSHDGVHLRTLLRDPKTGICMVIIPARWLIVTCYRNDPQDNHDTLKRCAYHQGDLPAWFLEEVPTRE